MNFILKHKTFFMIPRWKTSSLHFVMPRTKSYTRHNPGWRKWLDWLKNVSDKLSSVGFKKYAKYVLFSDCWTVFLHKWLNSECSFQQSSDWSVLRPTVQWLVSVVSNCQMIGQCCVQLSNSWSAECPTVRWLVNWASSCRMVGQCYVKLSSGWSAECQTVQWLTGWT